MENNMENMFDIMRLHDLQFMDAIGPEYKCTICDKILIKAVIAACNCRFCHECISNYLTDGSKECPGRSAVCKEELLDMNKNININRLINHEISRFSVKCPNEVCQSIMELIKVVNHLETCQHKSQSCLFALVGCHANKLTFDQVAEHNLNNNDAHIQLLINYICNSRNEIGSLKKELDKLRAESELKMSKTESEHKEIMDQIRRDNEEIRKKLRDNYESSKDTIQLLAQKVNANQIEIHSFQEKIQKLKQSVAKLIGPINERLLSIEQQCQMFEPQFDEAQQVNEKQIQERIDEILQQLQSLKCSSFATSIKTVENIAESIQMSQYILKIDNWANIWQKSRNSGNELLFCWNGFHSHPNGYKLCLAAWIYRYSLWLYFSICGGEFDDVLHWPFNRFIQVSIIDQSTGNAYKSWTANGANDPHNVALQKPSNATSKNEPVWIEFLLLSELFENPALILNNQISFKFASWPTTTQ